MSVITLFIPVNQIIKNIVRFNEFNNINVFFFFLIIVNILNQTVKLTIILYIDFPCLYRKISLSLLFWKLQKPIFFLSKNTIPRPQIDFKTHFLGTDTLLFF